jgi:hypothetical protein
MDQEQILKLAHGYLSEEDQEQIEALLDNGSLDSARIYLLKALNRELESGGLQIESLSDTYHSLGLELKFAPNQYNQLSLY